MIGQARQQFARLLLPAEEQKRLFRFKSPQPRIRRFHAQQWFHFKRRHAASVAAYDQKTAGAFLASDRRRRESPELRLPGRTVTGWPGGRSARGEPVARRGTTDRQTESAENSATASHPAEGRCRDRAGPHPHRRSISGERVGCLPAGFRPVRNVQPTFANHPGDPACDHCFARIVDQANFALAFLTCRQRHELRLRLKDVPELAITSERCFRRGSANPVESLSPFGFPGLDRSVPFLTFRTRQDAPRTLPVFLPRSRRGSGPEHTRHRRHRARRRSVRPLRPHSRAVDARACEAPP